MPTLETFLVNSLSMTIFSSKIFSVLPLFIRFRILVLNCPMQIESYSLTGILAYVCWCPDIWFPSFQKGLCCETSAIHIQCSLVPRISNSLSATFGLMSSHFIIFLFFCVFTTLELRKGYILRFIPLVSLLGHLACFIR